MWKLSIVTLVASVLFTVLPTAAATNAKVGNVGNVDTGKLAKGKIKNVILLIGDGMGPNYTTAYRYYKNDFFAKEMTPTAFDPYLVGMQTTYPDDQRENITDSAAAATAMATGQKTYNNAIAVDEKNRPLETVLERAKHVGKSTGLVATSEINHATPAAFAAHNESRKNYAAIADDYYDELIDGQHTVDVLLGGGKKYFKRKDRNLVKQFRNDGYNFVTNREQLLNSSSNKVLGLFADEGLPKAIDRGKKIPSLEEMTNAALKQLNKNENGFFLMVEGSQIDWAGHSNDVVGVMSEMKDFEQAFQAAIDFAKKDKHTLVIATADHETGGLSIGSDGAYVWNPEPIKQVKRTPEFMAQKIMSGEDVAAVLTKHIRFRLSDEEIQAVQKAADGGKEAAVAKTISEMIDSRTYTGWTTGGHTGVDVPVYAYGPGSERFAGLIDNTDIGKEIFSVIDKNGRRK